MIITREPVLFGCILPQPRRYMCVQKVVVNGKPKTLIADADTRPEVIIYMLDLLDQHGIRATEQRIEQITDCVEVA